MAVVAGGKSEHEQQQQVLLNSRSGDASRSEGGSSAVAASKSGGGSGAGVIGGGENGAEAALQQQKKKKNKRRGNFLSKQFEMITKGGLGGGVNTPRRNGGVNLLGQNYIIPVPGSRPANAPPPPADSDLAKSEEQNELGETAAGAGTPRSEKPPIEFVTAPVDYKAEAQQRREGVRREDPPMDFVTERSPRIAQRFAKLSTRVYASMSRSHSSSVLARSSFGSERLSLSVGSPRSERSVLSVPETVMSSAAPGGYSRGSLKTESRSSSPSSLAEWSSHSLDRRGELSIAGLSIGEGRNVGGISRRTDLSVGQSPARSDALHYSPDDTDSGVEMYHETTSASPGSYSSRRSSCSLSEGWMQEVEDSDGASHQYRGGRRSKGETHSRSGSYSSASLSRSQFGSAHYSPRTRSQHSPNTLQNLLSKELLEPSHGKMRHRGEYYDPRYDSSHRREQGGRRKSRREDELGSSNVVVLLNKHGRRKGVNAHHDDTPVALDSMTPEEAIAVFHDEVARMLLEEGQECGEAADVEEFLDGYMRLRSPFYVSMVDEFFRAVCVDCYKRPVEHHIVDGRSGSVSSKSLRSDAPLHHRLHHLHSFSTRM